MPVILFAKTPPETIQTQIIIGYSRFIFRGQNTGPVFYFKVKTKSKEKFKIVISIKTSIFYQMFSSLKLWTKNFKEIKKENINEIFSKFYFFSRYIRSLIVPCLWLMVFSCSTKVWCTRFSSSSSYGMTCFQVISIF